MSTVKNKDLIYAVIRNFHGDWKDSIPVCFTKTYERAQELAVHYAQDFLDRGYHPSEISFDVVGNIFYDE